MIRKIHSKALAVAATPAPARPSLSEILRLSGLMPLLMRTRNRTHWSPEQRAVIRVHLRRLRNISPYLVVLALPGSLLLLPVLVWWLDRRRGHSRDRAETPQKQRREQLP